VNIGVIGAGGVGGTLARHLANLGHEVLIANSRGPESLVALAAEIGATPASVSEASRASDVVIFAIPTKAIPQLPDGLFHDVPESVAVVDTSNYHPELRDGRIDAIDAGMLESEWVADQLGRPVVKAFNNIFAESLMTKGARPGAIGRVALPAAGGPLDARKTVLRLIDGLGFDPVDTGGLNDSWRQQTGTPAYCRDLNATQLRLALAAADRDRITEYREQEEARIKRSMSAPTVTNVASK
jgi:8-hydroxy-5-deazaflavin:NADPH oxidoreductase